MTLSTPTLLAGQVGSTSNIVTSASFTPTANALIIVTASSGRASGSSALSITDTTGLSWAKTDVVGTQTHVAIFTAVAPAAPGGMTVTVTNTNNTATSELQVWQVTGNKTTAPLGVTAGSQGNTTTFTTAPAADSMVFTAESTINGSAPTFTPPTGYSTVFGSNVQSSNYYAAAQRSGSAAQSVAWSSTSGGGIVTAAIEILAAASKPSFPTLIVEVNTTRDPNDPAGSDTWVDITSRVTDWSTTRGRSDELTDVQAGMCNLTLRSADGYFDPTNTGSPLYPYLQRPNRQIRIRATWSGTTYDIWRGYEVTGWPQSYDKHGAYTWCKPRGVDALGILGRIDLAECVVSEMLLDAPTALFTLGEPAGATRAGSVSGVRQTPAAITLPLTGSSVTFGQAGVVPALPGTAMKTATGGGLDLPTTAAFGATATGASCEFWFSSIESGGFANPTTVPTLYDSPALNIGTRKNVSDVAVTTVTIGSLTLGLGYITDGLAHHLVVDVAADKRAVTVFVDGVSVASGTSTTDVAAATAAGLPGRSATVNGNGIVTGRGAAGTFSLHAVYAKPLGATRALAHYTAGLNAFAGETASARFTRLLTYAAWLPALQTFTADRADAVTPLLAATGLDGTKLLSALQEAIGSTQGLLDVDGQGRVRYRDRDYKYKQTAPVVTFGEFQVANGEVAYVDIGGIDRPQDYLKSSISVTQRGGFTVRRSSATATLQVFGQDLQRTVILSDPGQVIDLADYLLSCYATSHERVATVTVEPTSNPNIWAQVLGLDYGNRVTTKRRTSSAAGVGITKSIDGWIEGVAWQGNASQIRVTFNLSPVLGATPWILGDATYGVLGTTTRLIF